MHLPGGFANFAAFAFFFFTLKHKDAKNTFEALVR
jgi:hypothetical protein